MSNSATTSPITVPPFDEFNITLKNTGVLPYSLQNEENIFNFDLNNK